MAVPRVGVLVEGVDHFLLEGEEEGDLQEVEVVDDRLEVVVEEVVHHPVEVEEEEGHHHLVVVVEEEDLGLVGVVGEEAQVGLVRGVEEEGEVVELQYHQAVVVVVAEQYCQAGAEEVVVEHCMLKKELDHLVVVVEVEGVLGRLLGMIVDQMALRVQLFLPLGYPYLPFLVAEEGPLVNPSQPGSLCPAGSWSG